MMAIRIRRQVMKKLIIKLELSGDTVAPSHKHVRTTRVPVPVPAPSQSGLVGKCDKLNNSRENFKSRLVSN